MKVGLQDIAGELNLSISTVSRSLSSHPAVSSETRAKVYETASRLGYRGPKGKMVRRVKEPVGVMNITVLIQTDYRFTASEDTVPGHLLQGMSEAAFELGVTMNVHYVPFKHRSLISQADYQPPAMRSGRADGLILIQHYPREVVLELSRRFPCVALCNACPGGLLDYVGFNNNYGIQKVVDHLHSLGHRKIGFVRSFEGTSWLEERFSGYIQGLSRLGLEYSQKNILSVEVDTSIPGKIPDLKSTDQDLLFEKTRQGVTAWVCVSDYIGHVLLRSLGAGGFDVPGQVSVAGFDHLPTPAGMKALTTLSVPAKDVGTEAIRRIISRVKNPAARASQTMFDVELEIGQTTGRAVR